MSVRKTVGSFAQRHGLAVGKHSFTVAVPFIERWELLSADRERLLGHVSFVIDRDREEKLRARVEVWLGLKMVADQSWADSTGIGITAFKYLKRHSLIQWLQRRTVDELKMA